MIILLNKPSLFGQDVVTMISMDVPVVKKKKKFDLQANWGTEWNSQTNKVSLRVNDNLFVYLIVFVHREIFV